MSKERYVEHTVAWELPNGDSVTKSNYNLADIETKYMPIQTEVICDDKDKTITDLEAKLAESESKRKSLEEKIKFLTEETEENFVDGQKYNQLVEKVEQLKEELIEKKGLERALSACNRQNDEFADMIKKLVSEKEELKQQLAEKEKEMAKLRELRAIKDDASQCVVVNGVKFSYEQILIIQDMNYNYDMKIKNLKQQLKSQSAEIVDKIGGEIYTRMVVECKETKYTDINLILDTILKEYQK